MRKEVCEGMELRIGRREEEMEREVRMKIAKEIGTVLGKMGAKGWGG